MQCNVYVFVFFIHISTDMVYHIYTAMILYIYTYTGVGCLSKFKSQDPFFSNIFTLKWPV